MTAPSTGVPFPSINPPNPFLIDNQKQVTVQRDPSGRTWRVFNTDRSMDCEYKLNPDQTVTCKDLNSKTLGIFRYQPDSNVWKFNEIGKTEEFFYFPGWEYNPTTSTEALLNLQDQKVPGRENSASTRKRISDSSVTNSTQSRILNTKVGFTACAVIAASILGFLIQKHLSKIE